MEFHEIFFCEISFFKTKNKKESFESDRPGERGPILPWDLCPLSVVYINGALPVV